MNLFVVRPLLTLGVSKNNKNLQAGAHCGYHSERQGFWAWLLEISSAIHVDILRRGWNHSESFMTFTSNKCKMQPHSMECNLSYLFIQCYPCATSFLSQYFYSIQKWIIQTPFICKALLSPIFSFR